MRFARRDAFVHGDCIMGRDYALKWILHICSIRRLLESHNSNPDSIGPPCVVLALTKRI